MHFFLAFEFTFPLHNKQYFKYCLNHTSIDTYSALLLRIVFDNKEKRDLAQTLHRERECYFNFKILCKQQLWDHEHMSSCFLFTPNMCCRTKTVVVVSVVKSIWNQVLVYVPKNLFGFILSLQFEQKLIAWKRCVGWSSARTQSILFWQALIHDYPIQYQTSAITSSI